VHIYNQTQDLIPNSSATEGKVFYYKMKGDYHRYLSEFQGQDSRKESSDKALEAYQVRRESFIKWQCCPSSPF
jgi:14-3-3 protein